MRTITEQRVDDWVAHCGVCDGEFVIAACDSPDIPSKSGSFCPDCRERRLMAPGVLNWRKRNPDFETWLDRAVTAYNAFMKDRGITLATNEQTHQRAAMRAAFLSDSLNNE